MQEIGLIEARTNLSKIAETVKRTGQSVTLMKDGQPYVDLVPHHDSRRIRRPHAAVLNELEELRHILVRQRRKMLAESQASKLLQLIDELTLDLIADPDTRTATGLAQTARPHQLSAYDAVYLDLAITLGLPLFMRDNNLRAAALRLGIGLVGESAA